MPLMRWSDGGNGARMRTAGQPVQQLCADRAASALAIGRLTGPLAPCNDEDEPRPTSHRFGQAEVQRGMRGCQRVTMQIDAAVGVDAAVAQATVPSCRRAYRRGCEGGAGRRTCRAGNGFGKGAFGVRGFSSTNATPSSGATVRATCAQAARSASFSPRGGFTAAAATGRAYRAEPVSTPGRVRSCRRRSGARLRPRPRRCRSGWRP